MPNNLFAWDELNFLRQDAEQFILNARQKKPTSQEIDDFCDYMEFVLCLVYAYGWQDAEEIVGIVPMKDGFDDKTVNQKVAGETFKDRVRKQIDELSVPGILRIIETESVRDYNTGVVNAADQSGKTYRKQWNTMMDEKVRETHDYLDGTIVGGDDRFYTFDGDSALAPGGFVLPENNINCRCWITILPD